MQGELDEFLDDWINPCQSDQAGGEHSTVVSVGQIDVLNVPDGWQEGRTLSPIDGSSFYREFHPNDHPEVRLCFFYRGTRCSKEGGSAFRTVLERPDHFLHASELESLREILREKTDRQGFDVHKVETMDINGKRVLVVEGRYLQFDHDLRSLLVDSDGTGRAVQEIIYQAPRADFLRFLPAANAALTSIRWK